MDPIQNNGMANYTMSAPQQNDIQLPQDDYSSMPMVYDPSTDEKKSSASSGIGMKALAAIGIAGLALWGGHAWGSKTAKAAEEAKTVAEEAKTVAEKALNEVKDKADKLQKANDAAYEIADKKYMGLFDRKKDLRNDIKNALRPNEAETKKVEETAAKEVGEGAKKVEEKAEETAKDVAKEAADDAAESAK